MNKYLLPIWDESIGIICGTFIENPAFCNQNSLCGRCLQYYTHMKTVPPGFYTCPHGLSTFVYESNGEKIIFTGFRERNTYRKGERNILDKKTGEISYNPILSSEQICNLVKFTIDDIKAHQKLAETVKIVDDTLHEIRTLNATIKSKCDILLNCLPQDDSMASDEYMLNTIAPYIRNISTTSYMIHSRFMLYDFFRNPGGQSLGGTFIGGVYKKFDKLRMILSGYEKRYVNFKFIGFSKLCYPLHSSFEILIFLILENAIKYSPDNESVKVYFSETINAHCNKLIITIKSDGPYCSPRELTTIMCRGIRGKNAEKVASAGSGIGLYLSKMLADLHKISIEVDSVETRKIGQVPYGDFSVKLTFDETLLCEPDY